MASFRYKHNTLVVTYSQKKNLMVVQKARTKRNHDAPSILFFGESFTRRSPNFSSNELTKVEIHLVFIRVSAFCDLLRQSAAFRESKIKIFVLAIC